MAEYYENYTQGPENRGPEGDRGTAPLILGLLSLIFSVTFSGVVGLVLGIIASVLGNKWRAYDRQANAGFIMGIIGTVISALRVLLVFFAFAYPMVIMAMF